METAAEPVLQEEKKDYTTCPKCACKGPNPGYETLADSVIEEEFSLLNPRSKWTLSSDKKSISRKFVCRNWQSAVNAIQAISVVAESEGIKHHPDLHLTNYRELEISIHTHSIGGLTNYDFLLARGIDAIEIDYSPKWMRENGL